MSKLFAGALCAMLLSGAVAAAPITGTIAFVGTFTDNVDSGTGNGTLDFANVIQWSVARTDDFSTVIQGDFIGVAFGPISVTGGAIDLPVNPMWALIDGDGDATSFILDTVTLYENNASGVAIEGSGWLSLTGYDNTRGDFSLDTADGKLTFDADATAVSAPGSVALLGLGVAGLLVKRRQNRL